MTMEDDLDRYLLQERARINVTELREVDYWVQALGVTEAQLRVAVAEVGVSAQDVRDHLGK
jgi:hypothetical protein